jgi:hypothetical protein
MMPRFSHTITPSGYRCPRPARSSRADALCTLNLMPANLSFRPVCCLVCNVVCDAVLNVLCFVLTVAELCAAPVPAFVGHDGQYLTGSVSPALADVAVRVAWSTDSDAGELTATTDASGKASGGSGFVEEFELCVSFESKIYTHIR